MSEFANEAGIWAARITGAVAGAGVSLVYLLPKSKREAASRFITGVSCGMIFGGPIGLWIVQQLDIAGALSGREIMVAGSAGSGLYSQARTFVDPAVRLVRDETEDDPGQPRRTRQGDAEGDGARERGDGRGPRTHHLSRRDTPAAGCGA